MSEPTTADVLLGALKKQTVALQMTATTLLEVLSLIDSPAPERWVAQRQAGFVEHPPNPERPE